MLNSRVVFLLVVLFVFTQGCRTEEGNERLADAGTKVGTSAATAVKSIKAGIEKVASINIVVADPLIAKGISIGKVKLGNKGGRHNMLNVYMIFDKKINRNVTMKVFNSNGNEIGRTRMLLKANDGEAKYIDFVFDPRTNIDRDHKISLE